LNGTAGPSETYLFNIIESPVAMTAPKAAPVTIPAMSPQKVPLAVPIKVPVAVKLPVSGPVKTPFFLIPLATPTMPIKNPLKAPVSTPKPPLQVPVVKAPLSNGVPNKVPMASPGVKAPLVAPATGPMKSPSSGVGNFPVKVPMKVPVKVPVKSVAPILPRSTTRINFGSNETVTAGGVTWEGDGSFHIPTGKPYAKCPLEIHGTDLDDVFCSERYFEGPTYHVGTIVIPVAPGKYSVRLMFAETWFTEDGMRVFDLLLQGKVIAESVDIHKLVGYETALIIPAVVEAQTTEGTKGSYIKIDLLNIIENSKISAIEIIPFN
jgi:Malectin domain